MCFECFGLCIGFLWGWLFRLGVCCALWWTVCRLVVLVIMVVGVGLLLGCCLLELVFCGCYRCFIVCYLMLVVCVR